MMKLKDLMNVDCFGGGLRVVCGQCVRMKMKRMRCTFVSHPSNRLPVNTDGIFETHGRVMWKTAGSMLNQARSWIHKDLVERYETGRRPAASKIRRRVVNAPSQSIVRSCMKSLRRFVQACSLLDMVDHQHLQSNTPPAPSQMSR
jgi:hypothetical protein